MKTPVTCNQQKHEGGMGEAHEVGPHMKLITCFHYCPRSMSGAPLSIPAVFRSSQILIISYILGWALWHERGYQESAPVESSFITKVGEVFSFYIDVQ